jgi:hypothetical protein
MEMGRGYLALVAVAGITQGLLTSPSPVRAAVLWNELASGDLSGDRFNPTQFTLNPGDNELFGILAGDDGQGGYDRDYYSVTVPAGHVLSQAVLTLYSSPDFKSFIGIQPGPIFPNDPDTVEPEDLLGWEHFGPDHQDADLLALMGVNGQGFVPPLAAGTYTLWAQQIDDFTEYTLDFIVEVPEPVSMLTLAASMLLACPGFRTRRGSDGGGL